MTKLLETALTSLGQYNVINEVVSPDAMSLPLLLALSHCCKAREDSLWPLSELDARLGASALRQLLQGS